MSEQLPRGQSPRALSEFCACSLFCGDDGDIDGDGTCKGLKIDRKPLIEIVLVRRDWTDTTRNEEAL